MRRTRNLNPQSKNEWKKAHEVQGEVKEGNVKEFSCNDCLHTQYGLARFWPILRAHTSTLLVSDSRVLKQTH